MTKKPANRFALPKVIISEVDSENILEFKVKYEKLARLDRFEVKAMHFDEENQIVFDEVLVNGGLIEVVYKEDNKKLVVEIEGKAYEITGQKIGGKQRLLENRVSKTKVQLELTNNIEDKEGKKRISRTERELIVSDNIKLYSQIVGREVKTTKEIYLIKRFLEYRSDLLFYYGFVDNFFKEAKIQKRNGYRELWESSYAVNDRLVGYTKFVFNDFLVNKEGFLQEYVLDGSKIKNDLESARNIFSALRHNLTHFNYDFFEKLFNGEDVGLNFEIEFLDLLIDNIDDLNIDAKKEFIEDEKIKLFGETLSLAKVYALYSHICMNRVGFNKFINNLLIKDGIERSELKKEFKKKFQGKEYYVNIHDNREYKQLYNKHKELVTKVSLLRDGQAIQKGNKKIATLKEKMNAMTKSNSLMRLECKLRLAFGFLYSEYNQYKLFKNNFDTDLKNKTYDTTNIEKSKAYFVLTYNRKKPRTNEKLQKVNQSVEKLKLKRVIEDDPLLKFILLMFVFMPKELKGEFLGFVKKYYHDIKNVHADTKDFEEDIVESLSVSLRLKILSKNIRRLTLFKHALSVPVNYNSTSQAFYEVGNAYGQVYKKLGISHNQEAFDKTLTVPLLRYYTALFKLMNDFEIYALAKGNESVSNLAPLVDESSSPYTFNGFYNFGTMLSQVFGMPHNQIKNEEIMKRNKIAHFETETLLQKPLLGEIELNKQRKEIIAFIESRGDMKRFLGFDSINDFRMKVVHLRTKIGVNSNKLQTMIKLLSSAKTPNDFYNIYKVKGVESINQHLLKVLGITEAEKSIEKEIVEGNRRVSS